jgi:2-methylcitrate dehydratase PrpD
MSIYTRRLAEFATNLSLSDVPADVVARAKAVILDGLGCGLFGAHLPWTKILADMVHDVEPTGGSASLWGLGQSASPISAALVNGTMIQGYELDDANPASIHSCAAVLPAVIAVTELIGADRVDGRLLLAAIVAGFEVGPRVGLCMNGNKMLVKGWHSPGIFGAFPAAAAAGVVLGLDTGKMVNALGIAGPQSAGIMATQYGSMAKRMLSGKSSQSGLYGALLAARGFTGVDNIFEAEYGGYCTTFTQSADQFDLSALTDGLGSRWETLRISLKRHASVGTNLAALDAIEGLVLETGLRADDVERVVVWMTEDAVRHSFWSPYEPVGLTAAQMHLGFCIAMKLIEGEVFVDQMVEENIARPDLLEFVPRVDVRRNPEREERGRAFARGADVEVVLKNGTVLKKTVDNFIGSYQRPMTDEQMRAKYRRLAAKALPGEAVDRLEQAVLTLEQRPNVQELVDVLKWRASSTVAQRPQ